jgi:hypothetical protein
MNPANLISPTLRQALRTHGFAKLSHGVLYESGSYPPADTSLREAGKALSMKFACDLVNRAIVRDGLQALKELHRGE